MNRKTQEVARRYIRRGIAQLDMTEREVSRKCGKGEKWLSCYLHQGPTRRNITPRTLMEISAYIVLPWWLEKRLFDEFEDRLIKRVTDNAKGSRKSYTKQDIKAANPWAVWGAA
jgi:hypothetical protein